MCTRAYNGRQRNTFANRVVSSEQRDSKTKGSTLQGEAPAVGVSL